MAFTNTKENGLESLIVRWLVEHNGYEQGTNADYNRDYAIDETRLFRFLQDTQPDALDKLGVFKAEMKKKQFLNRLQGDTSQDLKTGYIVGATPRLQQIGELIGAIVSAFASKRSNDLIFFVAVYPSITGIIRSIRIASNVPAGFSLNNFTACCPSSTRVINAPTSSRTVFAISAFSSLSSTRRAHYTLQTAGLKVS